jgi:endonuclease YncB( thermonuclease family)
VVAIRSGDTVEIAIDGRIYVARLAGIEAPEPTTAAAGDCYGDEAKDRLGELLIVGLPIWVSPDPATMGAAGSFTGYVWTWDLFGRHPRFVNEALLAGGFARFAPPAPDAGYDEPARLRQAQSAAVAQRRGLWGGCP